MYSSLCVYLYLSLSSLVSVDSVCHQRSENIWFDRLTVELILDFWHRQTGIKSSRRPKNKLYETGCFEPSIVLL